MKMFLLGAGASVDAGLESSVGLTKVIADRIGRGSYQNPTGQLLHAVVGAMIQHDTSNGKDAFKAPDVERVFAAVRSLKSRDDLDVSAFVERWNRGLDTVTGPSGLPKSWARNFVEALSGEHRGESELQQMFEEGVWALTESRAWELFSSLERQMLRALVKVLEVSQENLSYLSPMIRSSNLHAIATLNYDLSVETACSQVGLSVDTGLDRWRGGYRWEWDADVDVRLLKLHGSLDYMLNTARPKGRRMPTEHLERTGGDTAANPALVFGLGSKLRPDGPFLAMLIELERLLADTEWLTIVGYSFRDSHINAALTRWMNSEAACRLSIIDPEVDNWTQNDYSAPRYFSRLRTAASGAGVEFGRRFTWTPLEIDLLSTGAAAGLAELHGDQS